MWTPFVCENTCYMVDIDITNLNKLIVYVTDFKYVWVEELEEKSFIQKFKDLNPLIEPTLNKLIEKLTELIATGNGFVIKNDDNLDLLVKGKVMEVEINFKFTLSKGSLDVLFNRVTIPLLSTIQVLELQKEMLCKKLEEKDKEIAQYVFEKGEIKQTELKTEKFDVNSLSEEDNSKSFLNTLKKSKEFSNTLYKSLGIKNNYSKAKNPVKLKKTLKVCKPKKWYGLLQTS